MLAQGHEFDIVIACLFDVVHQLRGDLLIGVPAVGVVRIGSPRTQMHLVDVDRFLPVTATLCQPFLVMVDPAADAAALAESMTNFGFDRALYGFEREGFSAIRDAYKARCVNLGRHVTFDGGEGTALDVDEEGRLVVQGAEGSTHVFTGEVSVHGIYGAV